MQCDKEQTDVLFLDNTRILEMKRRAMFSVIALVSNTVIGGAVLCLQWQGVCRLLLQKIQMVYAQPLDARHGKTAAKSINEHSAGKLLSSYFPQTAVRCDCSLRINRHLMKQYEGKRQSYQLVFLRSCTTGSTQNDWKRI